MIKTKHLAFIALMAALANILSMPPLAIPIALGGFEASIHFFKLAIFLAGIITGPYGGLLAGVVGGLFMGVTKIPFIIGGIAILGGSVGFFAKRVRPVFAGILAWLVQAPYVVVTDYIWFTLFLGRSSIVAWGIITPIMIKLTIEAVINAVLANIIIYYIKRTGLSIL